MKLRRSPKKERLSVSDLDILHKATATIKNIDKIMMYSGYSRDGYSRDNYSQRGYSRDYEHDNSYGHYVRGHYSRDDGKQQMIQKLRTMMDESGNEQDRDAIRRCMAQLGNS